MASSIEVTVPRLGWSMEEGSFCRWLKEEGEMVREGDGLYELEGDKATQVVESFDAGVLRIGPDGPQSGDIVKVGQVLAHLEPRGGKAAAPKAPAAQPVQAAPATTNGNGAKAAEKKTNGAPAQNGNGSHVAAAPAVQPPQAAVPEKTSASTAPVASPSVRRLARELGIDLQKCDRDDPSPLSASELMRLAAQPSAKPAAASVARAAVSGDVAVTPRAKRVANELNVDPADAVGSGRNGRIREQDVRAIAANASSKPAAKVSAVPAGQGAIGEPITQIRRVIAQRMMAASHETAPVTLTARADASELVRFRDECKRTSVERGVNPPSYTELFVKLCAAALEKHPALLDQWVNERLVKAEGVNIAVAVATPNGLMTPVIRDVPRLSLRELSASFANLIELARTQRLVADQMRGGAFTVSSLGGYRVEAFTPILNPPQTAILGIGRISEQPVAKQRQLVVADVVNLSLTFDHRVVDGAPAAAFLTSLCDVIENPLAWLLG
ncbi:dihydrolipoamide acetyltransferase family protein [Lacipirellula sp.]|uniref:dihydrolipoamide acetyltransferase family protein n=1 Tax=Lacipirellula sp. TaxID=2691419 RepID=UPI003D0E4DBE